ncbi:MAG: hypothetical protein IJU23_12165 [Proteobacteria bacterium]|nr:hypothetical protein [Pseudomonadota bacterium]
MSKKAPLERLSEIFGSIRDTALEVHEQFEEKGKNPLNELQDYILGKDRRFDNSVRSTTLWAILLFTQPRLASQKEFQDAVSSKLPGSEAALIIRHLACNAPRAWSYRRSYQRGFAHTLAGPNAHSEISVDGCLSNWGTIEESDHLYIIGWTLTFDDHIFMIYAGQISMQQVHEIEKIRPFPLQLSEDDFWEENMVEMLSDIHESYPVTVFSNRISPVTTDFNPEQKFEHLKRIISGTVSSTVVRSTGSLQLTAATGTSDEILASVSSLVSRQLAKPKDDLLYTPLCHRVLEAIGCDTEGNMPHAHNSLLLADPVGLLLLPDTHEIYKTVGPRDCIRVALQAESVLDSDDVAKAFAIYQRERRWLAAFPCFDLNSEEHAAHFGIPYDSIEQIFAPQLFSSCLPIIPQGDVLRQLQNKYGFFQPDTPTPTFKAVLEAINSRAFMRSGNMSLIAQWLMTCCDRWRYCLCEIEPEKNSRTINQSNQKLLHKGLKNLSAMFKKK